MPIITAGFQDFKMAVKAGGALLDHGVKSSQFAMLAGHAHEGHFQAEGRHLERLEEKVQKGITTTTESDVFEGASRGIQVGVVLGALAGLASLIVPGYGLVVGGGALATAACAAAGTVAGGTVVGGVTGLLMDQGVEAEAADALHQTVLNDGAIILLDLPDDGVSVSEIRGVLEKYKADEIYFSSDTITASRTRRRG